MATKQTLMISGCWSILVVEIKKGQFWSTLGGKQTFPLGSSGPFILPATHCDIAMGRELVRGRVKRKREVMIR